MSSSSSFALSAPPPKRRRGTGRKKILLQRIELSAARQVTFSKRRNGLFNKAKELFMLTRAETAIIIFSPGGKPYTFGTTHIDLIVEKYLNTCNPVMVKKRGETQSAGQPLWDAPIEDLGLQELEQMKTQVRVLKDEVKNRLARNWLSL